MLAAVAHGAETVHLNALLLVGLAIAGGALGARLFKRIRVPQVVGYIAIGLLVGRSGFKLIDAPTLAALEPFNFFALGLIGFHLGGSLKIDSFKKHGRQFATILAGQGLCAAIMVGGLAFPVVYLGTGDVRKAAAVGLILGAIASATAPAATVEVLREYRARGPLTTMVLAIVALDNALALALFAVAISVAKGLLGQGMDVSVMVLELLRELGLAAALGVTFGAALAFAIRKIAEKDAELVIVTGTVLLVIGLAFMVGADPIMAAMALGFTVANLAPAPAGEALELTERFARPVFVLFFVMAGARLELGNLHGWVWIVVAVYIAGRMAGKTVGAALGTVLSGAPRVLRRYLGFCLASQAGVAVGLAILAGMRLGEDVGELVIAVVTTTVFFFEIVGPPMVKHAIMKAGEAGNEITEEYLISSLTVANVMDPEPPSFGEDAPLADILYAFSHHDCFAFPVLDDAGVLCGIITVDEIRDGLAARELSNWLLAEDLWGAVRHKVYPDMPLGAALEEMRKAGVEAAPAVFREDESRLAGMLDHAAVRRTLRAELLRRHAGQARAE